MCEATDVVRVRSVGYRQVNQDRSVVLSRQRLEAADFRGRRLESFAAEGVRFEGCRFDDAVIESVSFGAGRLMSEYVGCSFDGARLRMVPGGYARFVDCSFEKTRLEHWFCFAVEMVGCRFSGRLQKVVFNATVPSDDVGVVRRTANQW